MLVAGCDGGGHSSGPSDSARASGPPSTATSFRPSPTRTGPLTTGPNVQAGEKPPVLSEGAKQHTPAGALLFATYYFKAYDWGIATTDPYLVQQVSAPTCGACRRYVNGLNSLRRGGGYAKGGRINVKSTKLVTGSFRLKSDYVVATTLAEEALIEVRPSATPTTMAPATQDTSLVFVSWAGRGWQIIEVGAPS
jgi:hypothetical protein